MNTLTRRKIYENAVIARMMGIMQQEKVIDFVEENTNFSHLTISRVIRDNWNKLDQSAEEAEQWMNETVDHWMNDPKEQEEEQKRNKRIEEEQKRKQEDLLRMRQDQEISIQEIVNE